MASFNKVILLGNLTRDPEMRTANNGTSICRLGIAMSRVVRGSDGENREEVVFVDVEAFGKQAEVVGRYFTKGRPIFIDGRLRLDQWETPSGEKRSKLCIVLENFQFIGSRADNEGGDINVLGTSNFTSFTPPSNKRNTPTVPPLGSLPDNVVDEDVPF